MIHYVSNHPKCRLQLFFSRTFLPGTLWIKLASQDDIIYKTYEIYGVAALIGGGGSVMLITSLALTAELIGQNPESGAFVYGSMSLSDKVSNGVAVVLIQNFIPGTIDTCTDCQLYYRYSLQRSREDIASLV